MGIAYALLGESFTAIAEGSKAVSRLSVSDDAYDGANHLRDLVLIYTLIGAPDQAILEFETALSIPSPLTRDGSHPRSPFRAARGVTLGLLRSWRGFHSSIQTNSHDAGSDSVKNDEPSSGEGMGAVPLTTAEAAGFQDGISIEALVVRAQAGDSQAFEDLYRRVVGRIYALCLRMARDGQRAEELTQDVFVRAWGAPGLLSGREQVHYLAPSVGGKRRSSGGPGEGTKGIQGRAHSEIPANTWPEYREEMPGTRLDLERAIASLPDGARAVIILRDIYGYKYHEIATMQGVALGTVKAQIHRARKMMREKLES